MAPVVGADVIKGPRPVAAPPKSSQEIPVRRPAQNLLRIACSKARILARGGSSIDRRSGRKTHKVEVVDQLPRECPRQLIGEETLKLGGVSHPSGPRGNFHRAVVLATRRRP